MLMETTDIRAGKSSTFLDETPFPVNCGVHTPTANRGNSAQWESVLEQSQKHVLKKEKKKSDLPEDELTQKTRRTSITKRFQSQGHIQGHQNEL